MTDDPHDDPRAAPGADAPVDLTDDEVAVLAGRRAAAAPVVRRLTTHRRAGATGRLVTDKAAPPRLTAAEMASVRRGRRSTAAVRDRFAASEAPAEPTTELRVPRERPERSPEDAS